MYVKLIVAIFAVLALSAAGFETPHCKQSAAAVPKMMKCAKEILGREDVVPEDFAALKTDDSKFAELESCMSKEMGLTPTSTIDEIAGMLMSQIDIPDEERKKRFCDAVKECLGGTGSDAKKMRICFQETVQAICM